LESIWFDGNPSGKETQHGWFERAMYWLTIYNEVQCSGESSFTYLAKQVNDHALIRAILSRGASEKELIALSSRN
jgi:hypothetical protein